MKFNKVSKKQFDLFDVSAVDCKYEDIMLPKRATEFSAGYDIFLPFDLDLSPGDIVKIPTFINVELDKDKFLMIVPRSGLGFKYGIQLVNTTGIIDSDYINSDNEGHIMAIIQYPNYNKTTLHLSKNTAFCQGIILQYFKTDNDSTTEKRNGGFGSTTK